MREALVARVDFGACRLLTDGNELLEGPATASTGDDPATAILRGAGLPSESATKPQINTTNETAILPSGITEVPKSGFDKQIIAALFLLAINRLSGFFGYKYFSPTKLGYCQLTNSNGISWKRIKRRSVGRRSKVG